MKQKIKSLLIHGKIYLKNVNGCCFDTDGDITVVNCKFKGVATEKIMAFIKTFTEILLL